MTEARTGDVFGRLESDVRSYCRNFPATFVSGIGARLTTSDGREILDFLSAAGSLNYGHNAPRIMQRIADYITGNGIVNSLDLHTSAKEQFLLDLERIILQPRGLDYKVQFPGPTGTNAVEAALKLARKFTGRRLIAAFRQGFHGMSLGSLAVTSNSMARAGAGVPLEHVAFWPYEGEGGAQDRSIDMIEDHLRICPRDDRPAGVIVELVQGEGGLRHASAHWLRRLATICREYGILLIVDDIQAGCGRTGSFFSFEGTGVTPDIVLLSKSLSGFGAPLSIVLMRPELDIWAPGEHNGTFRGNNLAFVGASAAFTNYWQTDTFTQHIRSRADQVGKALSAMVADAPDRLRMRGKGLMVGLQIQDPGFAARCSSALFEKGVMLETCGHQGQVLKLLPPLNIAEADLAKGLDQIENVVSTICIGARDMV